MFGFFLLKYIARCSILNIRRNQTCVLWWGGVHMDNEACKKQEDIKVIVVLLEKATPEKVADILIFVKSYLTQ